MVRLRALGAAATCLYYRPWAERTCSEADMQLTVCRVLLAAGIKPAYRSSTASKLALGLVHRHLNSLITSPVIKKVLITKENRRPKAGNPLRTAGATLLNP